MSTRSLSLFALFLTFALAPFLLFSTAHAQESGNATLEGVVTSAETGEPLPSASVAVPALDRGASTGSGGTYRIEDLPAGRFEIAFSYVGYEPVTREVALARGETATLDVTLSSSTVQAEEVVVTGTPVAQTTLEATQDVDVVTPAEIERQRSVALGDLVAETVPGAASVQTGPQAGKPVLRGLTGKRIVVLQDGVAQEYYQFGVRHFPNTSLMEAGRIEVVRGPASLLYGSDALGGAINILTPLLPDEGFGGEVGAQYAANYNGRAGTAKLHGGAGMFGFRAGIQRRVAGNFTTPEEPTFFETKDGDPYGDPKYTGEVPFTNFEQLTGFAQVGVEGDFGSAQVYGSFWKNQHNFVLPPGGPDDDNPDNKPVLGVGQNVEHYNLAFKGNVQAGGFIVQPRLSYQRAVRQSAGAGNTLEDVEAAEGEYNYPLDLVKDVYTGRVEAVHPTIGPLSGTLGAEVTYQDGRSNGPVPLEPSYQSFNAGVFAFEELDLDPLTLSGGLRFDYITQEAEPPQSTREAIGLTRPEQLESSYATLSGSLGANYRFAEGWAVVSNFGAGFRAPSIFELYANGVHGGVAAIQRGNPTLDPERSYSIDLGVRARTGRLKGEVTGYYQFFRNYIYVGNTGETAQAKGRAFPVYRSAQTDGTIAGVEAAANVAVRPWLEIGAEAALLTSNGNNIVTQGEGGAEDGALPLIPADRLGGHVRFTPKGTRRFEAPFAEVEVRHAFSKDAAGRYEPFAQFDFGPPFGTASTRGYTLVDVTAGATLGLGPVRPTLTVGVENLFDTAYRNFLDTYKGYALSPGRNVFVKLSVPFGTGR